MQARSIYRYKHRLRSNELVQLRFILIMGHHSLTNRPQSGQKHPVFAKYYQFFIEGMIRKDAFPFRVYSLLPVVASERTKTNTNVIEIYK